MRRWAWAALLLASACARRPTEVSAVLETSRGRIVARLFPDTAPRTVAHLRALAGGAKPFYDGIVFHRVVPGFYIQTGDPTGAGRGDLGLSVPDEFGGGRRFDRPGLLGMASWGPGTSQTQFFITLSPQPDLDGRHTIFGEIIEGLAVAEAISRVPRDEKNGDRPLDPPVLKSLRITARP